mmetsp:Transcript_77456/g.250613  ORF Transcript_77456/g.250613 Transcript_77456/m.250613 type:complete len:236 (-) Transcript_77456:145-852(-)
MDVQPSFATSSTPAHCLHKYCTAATAPARAACINGVAPALSRAPTSARSFRSSPTSSTSLRPAQLWRAVRPSSATADTEAPAPKSNLVVPALPLTAAASSAWPRASALGLPACNRASQSSGGPETAARSRAVPLGQPGAATSARRASSSSTTGRLAAPASTARSRAVAPLGSCAFTDARAASRASTTCRCPCRAASTNDNSGGSSGGSSARSSWPLAPASPSSSLSDASSPSKRE